MTPISACVINHQGVDRLPAVLDALRASTLPLTELLVVDSGSTDGGPELLARDHPDVRVVSLGYNAGPAIARNRGFEAARYDRILFLDNDVRVDPACLAELEGALSARPGAVLSMPRVLDSNDPSRIHFEGADAHCLGQMIPRRAGERDVTDPDAAGARESGAVDDPDGAVEVGSMISACFLVDRSRLEGLRFDPLFEFDYEDHDFGLRCRSAGGRLLAVPSARCLHGTGTPGFSVRDGTADPPERVRRLVVARRLIVARCYARRTVRLLMPAFLLFEAVQWAWLARSGRLDAWRAARDVLRAADADILRMRADVAARRSVRDGRLLVGGPLPVRSRVAAGAVERFVLATVGVVATAWWRTVRGLA